jgi:hypothetical protein
MQIQDLPVYDLKVTDVNGDKRPDVIIMYESGAITNAAEASRSVGLATRNGSVHAFLNRGFAKAEAQATKSPK